MTMPAARDLRGHGIRVVTIAPGAFLTPPMERLEPADRDLFAGFVQAPGRLGDPAEFGALVVQLSGNSYVNATTVRLDGGARVGPRPG
jgi:NAD(P)-dependent dehydrogenase (short-subunit alcohol dehydrogenase family)